MRRDRVASAIIREWRRLTSGDSGRSPRLGRGEATLVACSGGADSVALAVVLRAASDRMVIGHVVHDLRPRAEALADRDVARALADALGVGFFEREVRVRAGDAEATGVAGPGNLEGRARTARYAALADMARVAGVGFVATAHHADDQLENVLMSLVRGTGGGGGIRGMPRRRRLAPGVMLVRPMLCEDQEVTRDECRRLCQLAGVRWSEDATNLDLSRARSAIRHRIVPVLKGLRAGVSRHAVQAVVHARGVENVVVSAALELRSRADVRDRAVCLPRDLLRTAPGVVVGELIRQVRQELVGPRGADGIGRRGLVRAVRAIHDRGTESRRLALAGLEIRIASGRVDIQACRGSPGKQDQ